MCPSFKTYLKEFCFKMSRPEPTPWAVLALDGHCWPRVNRWPNLPNSMKDNNHTYNDQRT